MLVKLFRIGQKIVKIWTRHFEIECYIETVKKDSILSSIQMPTYIRRMQSNWSNSKGQLISKCLFVVIISTKIATKIL